MSNIFDIASLPTFLTQPNRWLALETQKVGEIQMLEPEILLKYDGGDAIKHTIDAKLYGQSLQGLDRMISDCLIVLSLQRLPRRGERAPLLLKAREGVQSSYGAPQLLQEASQLLGVGVPILTSIGPDIVGYYVHAVLDHFRGDEKSVDLAINKMAEMHEVALKAMSKMHKDSLSILNDLDERRHAETMGMQDLLRRSIASNGPAAAGYVAPVGESVDTVTFYAGKAPPNIIRLADAEAIRDSQKVDWQPPKQEVFVTDGFKYHTSELSIQNPDDEGFLMAEVKDPVFLEDGNAYTLAAQKRARIEVLARRRYKNGKLSRIHILDFVREITDRAA
ncbi:hypothetical protein I5L01_06480 [Erythrobacter sp. YJ-T3-07]|uniref:DUF7946 domain-containing protein n=1 Tax=Erythrobacter sp. YJ-T3-07 TaxID=2793063 RepID=UPI0018D27A47|nr:hypothetical protein [Erythrobacter sp. YJ-T3-07]MBH1943880.1 hypothetical protein [Erythrobacter sp. YJ-T3-07]